MSKEGLGSKKNLPAESLNKFDGGDSAGSKTAASKDVQEQLVSSAYSKPSDSATTKPSFEDKQTKAAQRDASSSATSDSKAAQKESSSSSGGDSKSAAPQAAEKAADSGKSQPVDTSKPTRAIEQNTQTSEKSDRNAGPTGKQAEHISTTQPEGRSKDSSSSGGDNQERRGGAGGKTGGDADASPREKGSAAVAPETRGDAGSAKSSDPKGGAADGSPAKSSDATRSPETRTSDTPKSGDSQRPSDTARDGAAPRAGDAARQDSPKDATQRSETKLPESGKEREPAGRSADQITKTGDVSQERTARQFEKDPIAAGKPTDAQAGKQVDQKLDALLLDSKQVGLGQQGRGQEKVDPKDVRQDAGQKVPDGRQDAGQKTPEARVDAGSRIGGGGGADARMDAGRRPGDAREGERIGIIGGDKGVAAGRLDVHISADAVKLHLPEKGGQEIVLTDRNTQRNLNDAFGLFDKNEFKQIATNFKQQVDLWTELTSKQFNGLKDTIANVLDAPKASAMKELSAWAQDLSKRPEGQPDVRQELGHTVKMQLLDSLKRNDDTDRRHADLKERCVNLLDEFKQIRTDLQGRCEEAIKIARSFFTSPIERPPVVHIADSPTKKLTEAEIDELLNVRLREFTPPKSKDEETEKGDADGDKADSQAAAVQQAMQQASHTVKKGETVAMIAAKYCGSEECAVLIAEMNRGVISATYEKGNLVFHAPVGAVLTLPYDRDIREFKEKALGLAGNFQDSSQF